MFNTAGKFETHISHLPETEKPSTPRNKNPEQGGSTPRLTSTQDQRKAGAKKLESLTLEARRNTSPAQFANSPLDTDANGTLAMPGNIQTDQAPRLKAGRKHESDAIGNNGLSSPRLNLMPASHRNAPTPPGKVPPLKIPEHGREAGPRSPAKSEKPNPATKELAKLVSSNAEAQKFMKGWKREEKFGEMKTPGSPQILQPAMVRSPSDESKRKRKSEYEIDHEKKRARFEIPEERITLAAPPPMPAQSIASYNYSTEINRLNKESAESPTKFRSTSTDDENAPAFQENHTGNERMPTTQIKLQASSGINPEHSVGDNTDEFPVPPNRLAKLAIKSRQTGKTWIEKASGDSLTGRLQRTLDQLIKANDGKINTSACAYLQEMFGLLPAGANTASKTFNYMLLTSFYCLGLTYNQWKDIDTLYQDFDTLDVSANPDAAAEFKMQLGEIIAAKNELARLRGREMVKEKAEKGDHD